MTATATLTTAPTMTAPIALDITYSDSYDGAHACITVMAVEFADADQVDDDQLSEAYAYPAHVLARLVAFALGRMRRTQHEHGCLGGPGDEMATCGIDATGCHLEPRETYGEAPMAFFIVPRYERREWVKRVGEWLAQIIAET